MTARPLSEEEQRRRREAIAAQMPGLITLVSGIGNNFENQDNDVRRVREALELLGDVPEEEREYDYQGRPLHIITQRMEDRITDFQRKNDLKADGILRPGGETIGAINKGLAIKNAAAAASAEAKSEGASDRPVPPPPRKPERAESTVSKPATSEDDVPPVPEYRKEVFKGDRAQEWADFNKTVEGREDLSPVEKRMLRDIFAAEGGMDTHPGSGAHAGILPSTLKLHVDAGNLPDVVGKHGKDVKNTDLDMNDVVDVYKSHLDDTMRSAIKGYEIRNPDNPKNATQLLGDLGDKVGGAVADTLFKNAGKEGSKMIIKAINQNLPPADRLTDPQDIGSKTYGALTNIAADKGKTKSFLESLALIRVMQEKNGKNEMDRIYYPVLKNN